jgi:hypothetical protein
MCIEKKKEILDQERLNKEIEGCTFNPFVDKKQTKE